MGRISRKCYESSYFHVMTQGINKEFIFKEKYRKRKYLKDLTEKCNEQGVILLAYCIMGNHAHLLLYTKEIKALSKTMASVNTKYAIYYNKSKKRCGFVFRDRYRCENIVSQNHLENCLRYIHNNPVEAEICDSPGKYEYSSFNDFMNQKVPENVLKLLFKDCRDYKSKLLGKVENYYFIDTANQFGKADVKPIKEVFEYLSNCDFSDRKNVYKVACVLKKKCNASNDEIIKIMNLKRATFYRIMKTCKENMDE